MAFDRISPIGDERGDLQAGIIASNACNLKRTKQGQKIFAPADFMPYLEKSTKDNGLSKQIRANFSALKKAE